MYEMVNEGVSLLTSRSSQALNNFGMLLNEGWKLKRSLTTKISTPLVDKVYAKARKNGALGGKLLGAGGGGFMLIFAKPEDHPRIRRVLRGFLRVPFSFETGGSQIIFYQIDELVNGDGRNGRQLRPASH